MVSKTSSYRQALLASLTDPVEAAEYLNAAIEDSLESFLKALGNVAQARQMTKVAKDAGIQRETLYRSFSIHGNPTFVTLSSVLEVVGLKMNFEPLNPIQRPPSGGGGDDIDVCEGVLSSPMLFNETPKDNAEDASSKRGPLAGYENTLGKVPLPWAVIQTNNQSMPDKVFGGRECR